MSHPYDWIDFHVLVTRKRVNIRTRASVGNVRKGYPSGMYYIIINCFKISYFNETNTIQNDKKDDLYKNHNFFQIIEWKTWVCFQQFTSAFSVEMTMKNFWRIMFKLKKLFNFFIGV